MFNMPSQDKEFDYGLYQEALVKSPSQEINVQKENNYNSSESSHFPKNQTEQHQEIEELEKLTFQITRFRFSNKKHKLRKWNQKHKLRKLNNFYSMIKDLKKRFNIQVELNDMQWNFNLINKLYKKKVKYRSERERVLQFNNQRFNICYNALIKRFLQSAENCVLLMITFCKEKNQVYFNSDLLYEEPFINYEICDLIKQRHRNLMFEIQYYFSYKLQI